MCYGLMVINKAAEIYGEIPNGAYRTMYFSINYLSNAPEESSSHCPAGLNVLLKSCKPYPSGCFSPTIMGTVSFSSERHSSTPTGSS